MNQHLVLFVAEKVGFEPTHRLPQSTPLAGEPLIATWVLLHINGDTGGERGIRTLDTVPRIHDFQSCALDQLSHLSIRCSTRFLSYTITVHFARLFSPFRMKRLYVRFQIPRVSFLSVVRSALRYSVGATPQCCLKKAENALSLINPARSEISATVRSAYFR